MSFSISVIYLKLFVHSATDAEKKRSGSWWHRAWQWGGLRKIPSTRGRGSDCGPPALLRQYLYIHPHWPHHHMCKKSVKEKCVKCLVCTHSSLYWTYLFFYNFRLRHCSPLRPSFCCLLAVKTASTVTLDQTGLHTDPRPSNPSAPDLVLPVLQRHTAKLGLCLHSQVRNLEIDIYTQDVLGSRHPRPTPFHKVTKKVLFHHSDVQR